MLACVDVSYGPQGATAACLVWKDWSEVEAPLEVVVIDGYVWLSGDRRPGLGAHLFQALGGGSAVIGVAKTSFQGATFAEAVLRGGSARPLFVTAAGVEAAAAAGWIRAMHGAHRIPTLLKRVDRLCRTK